MAKKLSKRAMLKRHVLTHKKHYASLVLLIFLAFGLAEITIFAYQNFNSLIYPELPRSQLSPKQLINDRFPQSEQKNIPPIVEHGSRFQYKVALTFDADMTVGMQRMLKLGMVKSWYDQTIKQTLDRENAKATIFFTTLWVQTYSQEAKQLAQDPLIEIGNHSYSHPAFTKDCLGLLFLDDAKGKGEVFTAQEAIKKATGVTPKYFRFPGSCFDKTDLQYINNLGLKVIYWDIASTDGFNNDASSIIQTVESKVQNGSIIVFHLQGGLFAPKTSEALTKIIPDLKRRGYQLVTISKLLNETDP